MGTANATVLVYRSLRDYCNRSMYDYNTALLLWAQSSLQLVH